MLVYKLLMLKKKFEDYLYTKAYCCSLGKSGKDIKVEHDVTIYNPQKISIEDNSILKKGTVINSRVTDSKIGIKIGKYVKIHEYAYIDDYGGEIFIDDYSGIGQHCVIGGQGNLHIGKKCMIAGHTYIIPANHIFEKRDVPFVDQGETKKGIVIEDNVWIGAGCIILDGVVIGKNSIIGAGSVVTRDIPSGVIAVGIPAKVIKEIVK